MQFADLARSSLAAGFVLALLTAAPAARAGDKALAESLFQDGRKLLDEGKYDLACQKFEGSQKQDPSPGTLLNLGKCNEARGKTATAWANYKEAESLARNMSRPEQEQMAIEKANAIEPRLSRLTITAPPTAVEGLVVKRGGISISVDALGSASPVDPGEHVIEASAPGYETWTGKVTVGKEKDSASIAIPELKKAPEAPPPVAAPGAGEGEKPAVAGGAVKASSDQGSTKTLGYVLVGVGAVGLLAGGYFGYAANKQASDAEDDPTLCPGKVCTSKGRDEIDSAKGKALISTIAVGTGVAALGAGIVLIAIAPSNKEQARWKRPHARVAPFADGRNAGLSLTGAF